MNDSPPQPSSLASDYQNVSLRDIVTLIFRRLLGMSIIFGIAMILALVWIFAIRVDVYEATAKILVRIGHEQSRSVTVLNRETPVIGYRYQDVATEVHILSSTDILERVVDQLNIGELPEPVRPQGIVAGLVFDLRQIIDRARQWLDETLIKAGLRPRLDQRQAIIAALSKGLSVGSSQESNILIAQLRLPYREGTAAVLDSILDTYLTTRLSYFQEEDAVNLFRARMNQALEDLLEVEARLERLEAQSNISNLEVQEKLLLELEQGLDAQVKADTLVVAALKSKLERLKAAREDGGRGFGNIGAFPGDSFPGQLMSQLAQIENERIEIESAASGDQRTLEEIDRRFTSTLDLLQTNVESVYGEHVSSLEERRKSLADVRAKIASLHETEVLWRNLRRRAELLEADYKFYRHEVEEASVTSSMQTNRISTVKVIQRPTDSLQPAGIRKLYLIYIATVLSAFLAICWASIAEFLDHRIYTPGQVARHLRSPTVGVVAWTRSRELERILRPSADTA